ncbi:hypothetical protein HYW84_01590 [Candidatus Peregrinibacteria bacterium]|nr:hypothetical protein [Candidatus Peregrinibacteria bacterium]
MLSFWFLIFGIFLRPSAVIAQDEAAPAAVVSAPACNNALRERLAQQQRILRQIWFGRKAASELPVNSVRWDANGVSWMKMEPDVWRAPAKGNDPAARNDAQIDSTTEWEGMNEKNPSGNRIERIGIFEQKQQITSELIPELTQSFRAFQCRAAMVCETAYRSFLLEEPDEQGLISVLTPGCDDMVAEPIAECRFGNADSDEGDKIHNSADGFAETVVRTECGPLVKQLADREAAFLRVAVSYDAAVRSLMQSSGSFDEFLRALRADVLAPLEQTMPLLSKLGRIPCFSSQCNE